MTIGIYGIFDSETNVCLYIGQSKHIETRHKEHLKELRSGRHRRKDFVDWFNESNRDETRLIFRTLETCKDIDTVKNSLEIKYFNLLQPKFYGVQPSLKCTWALSAETRKKLSEKTKENLKNNPAFNKNPRKWFNCRLCNRKILNQEEICAICKKNCKTCQSRLLYERKVIELYVEKGLSIRSIKAELSVSPRLITQILRNAGIEIQPRTFNGHTHTKETREVIQQSLKGRKTEIRTNICLRCGQEYIRKRPHDTTKYCSRKCYVRNGEPALRKS